MLSQNINAIHLLEKNQEKIHWSNLSRNPSIFKIDYKRLYKRIEVFYEELMQKCSNPNRVKYYLEKYGYDILEEKYLYELNVI